MIVIGTYSPYSLELLEELDESELELLDADSLGVE
jgi:hypothetical protein